MDDLLKTLQKAGSVKKSIRMPAENKLKRWEDNYFSEYLIGLVQILNNSKVDRKIRQLAGLQAKNLVGGGKTKKSQDILTRRYLELSLKIRQHLRDTIAPVLGSDLSEARKTAALIVAKMAKIELPQNLWPELMPMLIQATEQNNVDFKESALLTLGYISEECENNIMKKFTGQILNFIQNGITNNYLSVRLAAAKALLNCLTYVDDNMKIEEQRKIILEMIFLCCKADGNDQISINIRVVGFLSLGKLSVNYYDDLSPEHIEFSAKIAFQAMSGKIEHEEVRKQAIEFWSGVFEEEVNIEKSLKEAVKLGMEPTRINIHYAEKACESLCPLLLEMLMEKTNDIDDDIWTVEKSAASCLKILTKCLGSLILSPVLQFVEKNLLSQEWQRIDASITAIGIIMEGQDQNDMLQVIPQIWQPLIKQLTNGEHVVKDSTAYCLGRIFQYCPKVLDRKIIIQIVETFCKLLQRGHAKVANSICWAIGRLALLCEPNKQNTPLSSFNRQLLKSLITCASRSDIETHNLLPSCFEAINLLIKTSGDDMITILKNNILDQMIIELQNLVNGHQSNSIVNKTRELIATTTAVVARIGSLSDQHGFILMELYLKTLNTNGFNSAVHEEAMAAIGDIATIINNRFIIHLPKAAHVIQIGLRDGQLFPNLCCVALCVLGDVAAACKEKIYPFTDDFISLLLKNLSEPNINFELKPRVVETIGDIANAIRSDFVRYVRVPYLMKPLILAGSSSPPEKPNQEIMIKINELRQAVLECLIHILDALQNYNREIVNYYSDILNMLYFMNKLYPSECVVHHSLCIIEDMITICPNSAISRMKNAEDFIQQLLKINRNDEIRQISSRIRKKIEKLWN